MIVFDLQCRDGGERFEAWFHSNADYEHQASAGLVECPFCRSASVEKAPMAPAVPRKGSADLIARIAAAQAEMLKGSEWVGDKFAETARAMHNGECDPAPVYGQASLLDAKSLIEDGVAITPLPLPVVPPAQVN
jgi:hypothetical protein